AGRRCRSGHFQHCHVHADGRRAGLQAFGTVSRPCMSELSMSSKASPWGQRAGIAALVLALALFPLLAPLFDLDYYTGFVRRLMIVALAAASLNFLMGRVGLVALGHAGFVGVGAYAVAVLAEAGWTSAWL